MKVIKSIIHNCIFWMCLLLVFALSADPAFAATTGNTLLFRQVGSGSNANVGDYISATAANGGINRIYQIYLEVPPNTTSMTVRLFDLEIGGTDNGGDLFDWQQGTGYNTRCRYTLYTPAGVQQVTLRPLAAAAGYNNTWYTLATVANPAAGHWRLVADMTSAQTGGDDCNGWGFDVAGTNASGSVEIKAYAYSFVPVGELSQTAATMTITYYPYITSGCTTNWKDFDGDTGTGACTITYRSGTGATSGSYTGSGSTVWLNRPINLRYSDSAIAEAGLWTWTGTYTQTGANGGNFGVIYMGNFNNATTPPTTQPQGNTFRIYFPSGTGNTPGGAPAKPYLTQKISYVSGLNPPVSGSTTRVRVEIAFVNPTAWPVTFSSANAVTANVPSTRVVYRGNVVMSAGSIVSQPGDGSSGNVVWNPGTVAAGATATLYYQVDVTPTAADQYTEVTGVPATAEPAPAAIDGTWARYLDETGNQTAIFGPLCALRVYSGSGGNIPTWVSVSCFDACAEESQPTVEWRTASEMGPMGFNLWRQDPETKEYVQVNPFLLPALPNSPQGGVYRFADPGAFSGEPVTYKLEEVDAQGRSMTYGPYTVTFGASFRSDSIAPDMKAGREVRSDAFGFQRFERERTPQERERLDARRQELQRRTMLASKHGERARVTVKGKGLFYVAAAQVASAMGISEAAATALIGGCNLSLSGLGKEIAWLADANGAGLFFYNPGIETVFSDRNVYFLEQGRGKAMETTNGGNAGPASGSQSFKDTLHFENNAYALLLPSMDPGGDLWFWDYVIAGSGAKAFSVQVPSPAATGRATLAVSLQGATEIVSGNDHHAYVFLNGRQVGETSWDGLDDHVLEASFDTSLLRDGANTVSVSGVLENGAPYGIFYVESFDLSYPRYYKAVDNSLACRGDGNAVVTVSGLTELQAAVLDVSTPEKPKQLTGVAPDLGGRVTFVPRSATIDYLVSGLNAAKRPVSVVGAPAAKLNGSTLNAEYLVIAPEEFSDTAQALADFRQGKGLKSTVVTLEDIYDAYSYGVPTPYAIRSFLADAYGNGNGRRAKYAVLAGKGTYDYNDYQGNGDNVMPVIMGKTPDGLCAADKAFGDVKGSDGLPEIAVGRLPAVTNAELKAMIDKIKAYEGGQGAWTDKALFIADNPDDGGDFTGSSDELVGLLSGMQAAKVYLTGTAAETRAKIIAAWNAGAALVNYCGHAGINQLAAENIFNDANAAALQNGGQLPLAVMITCVAGRFELPGYASLGEALLLNANGGMAGGLLPSGLAINADSMLFAGEFYKAAYRNHAESAGMALLTALKNYLQQGGSSYLINAFNWLGDPAATFK